MFRFNMGGCNMLFRIDTPLMRSPKAVQLTVHVNNILLTYPDDRSGVLKDFKKALTIPGYKVEYEPIARTINNIGAYYYKVWFGDIYGWTYPVEYADKKEASK